MVAGPHRDAVEGTDTRCGGPAHRAAAVGAGLLHAGGDGPRRAARGPDPGPRAGAAALHLPRPGDRLDRLFPALRRAAAGAGLRRHRGAAAGGRGDAAGLAGRCLLQHRPAAGAPRYRHRGDHEFRPYGRRVRRRADDRRQHSRADPCRLGADLRSRRSARIHPGPRPVRGHAGLLFRRPAVPLRRRPTAPRAIVSDGIRARFRLDYPGFRLDARLDLPGRGVTALFGPSGSGKTTALRCIAGLERAADAYLAIGAEVWQDDANGIFVATHRRALGYVFQEASLFPHLSVRRNLEYGLKRIAAAERRVAWDQAIELMGIGALMERMPERLSGGERQRVAIVRALLTSPRLLLMDEPLAALDAQRKAEILPYLERLHRELEIPLLYVSHAADEVARLADTLVVMQHGRVVAQGALSETLARLDLPIRLGEDAGVVLDGRG